MIFFGMPATQYMSITYIEDHFFLGFIKYSFQNYKLISKTKTMKTKNCFVLDIAKSWAGPSTIVKFFNPPPQVKLNSNYVYF